MSSSYDTYYEFESGGSCELCNAMEGIYTEIPPLPHDYCHCNIYEVTFDDDYESGGGNVTIELASKTMTSQSDIQDAWYEQELFNHGDHTSNVTHSFGQNLEPDVAGDIDEIEKYIDLSDAMDSLDVVYSWDLDLGPGCRAVVSLDVEFVTYYYEVELVYIDDSTGETIDTKTFNASIQRAHDFTPSADADEDCSFFSDLGE
jgi:hypothetical protein